MARRQIRHYVEKRNRDGTWRRYWQPTKALREAGWQPVKLSETDAAGALAEAERWNAKLDLWRASGADGAVPGIGHNSGAMGLPAGLAPPPARIEPGTVAHLLDAYEHSRAFEENAANSRKNYRVYLRQIAAWAIHPETGRSAPVAAITPARAQKKYDAMMQGLDPTNRRIESMWAREADARAEAARLARDKPRRRWRVVRADGGFAVARISVASAEYFMTVLKIVWRWGMTHEPFDRLIASTDKGYPVLFAVEGSPARVRAATLEEERAMIETGDRMGFTEVGDFFVAAAWSGQRPSDVLDFTLPVDDGERLRGTQAKTGERFSLRRAPALVARTAAIRARHGDAVPVRMIVDHETGQPLDRDDFRTRRWNKVRDEAAKICPSVADLRPQDMRDTTVTRLAMAEVDIPGICSITRHTLKTAHQILTHYLELNEAIADAAIARVVAWYEDAVLALDGQKLDAEPENVESFPMRSSKDDA